MTTYNVRADMPDPHPLFLLWHECRTYAARSTADKAEQDRMAREYFFANAAPCVDVSPAVLRELENRVEGLRSINRRGVPELEIVE